MNNTITRLPTHPLSVNLEQLIDKVNELVDVCNEMRSEVKL